MRKAETIIETKIGFSTGCLYKTEIPLEDQISLFASLGATAIELSFSHPDQLRAFHLSETAKEGLKKFHWVSIHAPWKDVCYKDEAAAGEVIRKLRAVCDQIRVYGVVFHPTTIADFDFLDHCRLPVLLENMDKRKGGQYARPEQFRKIMNTSNFGLTLDLQHAYEHDPTMKSAKKFLALNGNGVIEMHVSGEAPPEIHWPVHLADNQEAVVRFLKKTPDLTYPAWILEGLLAGDIAETAFQELLYMRRIIRGR